MQVFITGATGFVGRALVLRLLRDGHQLSAWTRDGARARDLLGPDVEVACDADGDSFEDCVARADAVVHLAGENLFSGRWSGARKRRIEGSRVAGARRITEALEAAPQRARVFLSASAVGFFGDRGDERLDERSAQGSGFLADLCGRWEAEALAAAGPETRVAVVRLGLVFGSEGGAMSRLLPLFRAGVGGRLGAGNQWTSWVHLHDLVNLLVEALTAERYEGVLHAVAPEPLTNRDLTAALAGALGRRAGPPLPGWVLKTVLGEAASVLLGGQRVLPTDTTSYGFTFCYPDIASALGQILDESRKPTIRRTGPGIRPMPGRAAASHVLEQETWIQASLDDVFPFFSRAANLALLTPTWTDFRILEHPTEETTKGSEIVYRLKLFGVPIRWRTRIARWSPGQGFVDTQLSGPYRLWWHEHEFESLDDGSVQMVDRVFYRVPFGPIGSIANKVMVEPLLRRIFAWRAEAIRLRFDPRADGPVGVGRRAA